MKSRGYKSDFIQKIVYRGNDNLSKENKGVTNHGRKYAGTAQKL